MKHLFIISMLISISILNSCKKSEDLESAMANNRLETLERKYHVKIENTKNLNLNLEDFAAIEKEIISFKEQFKPLSKTGIPLKQINKGARLKTTATEAVEVSAWALNLSWMHVSVAVEDDESVDIESWLTGVTIYSYEQKSLSHDFSPNQGQKEINFDFVAVCTVTLADYMGVKITAQGDVSGSVNLETNTGELEVDGY